LAEIVGMQVINCSCTMATTREGLLLVKKNFTKEISHLLVQFGLVDSYKTFKYSPYVLYFPDNFIRKQLRSLVKKYKKFCRNSGLNKRIGEINVVSIDEYEKNLQEIVDFAKRTRIFLIDTIPHKNQERNPDIQRYNAILSKIAQKYPNCTKIDLYTHFNENLEHYYLDETHCNAKGYEYIVRQIIPHFQSACL